MGYERRVWDQEGTICPAPVTARKPSTCKPFSDEESSFASCGKQRRKAQFAPDCIPGLEPVTKASWQVTICRGVSWAVNCSRPRSEAPPSSCRGCYGSDEASAEKVAALREQGLSLREVAASLEVGIGTVHSAAQGTLQRPFANSP